MKKKSIFLLVITLVSTCFFCQFSFAGDKDNEHSVGEIIIVRINKYKPTEINRVICYGMQRWGQLSGNQLIAEGGSSHFEYEYKGIENNEVKISFRRISIGYRDMRLPLDEKKQATLQILTGQKLLLTVINEKNDISVQGVDEVDKLIKYPSVKESI